MSDASTRLPNLYQLLALSPLESDRDKINAAVKRLLGRSPTPDVAEPSQAHNHQPERIQKIAALAQKYLLDPQRKAAYDQQWMAIYSQPSAPAASLATSPAVTLKSNQASLHTTSQTPSQTIQQTTQPATEKIAVGIAPAWDCSRLDVLLPQGDPQAPFDMAAFLRTSESRDPLAAEADFQRLIALLADETAAADVAESIASESSLVHVDSSQAVGSGQNGFGTSRRSDNHVSSSLSPTAALARRMQKKKQRALIIGASLFSMGIVGLIILGAFVMSGNSRRNARQMAQPASPRPAPRQGSGLPKIDLDGAVDRGAAQSRPPVSSGLPQPGQGNATLDIDAAPSTLPNASASNSDTSLPANPMPASAMPANPMPTNPMPTNPMPTNPMPTNPMPTNPMPTNPMPTTIPAVTLGTASTTESAPGETTAPQPAAMVDAKLTKEDKEAWRSGMMKARELIAQYDFAAAEKELAEHQTSAKTELQRGQLERLGQVNGLVKNIHTAIVEAITGMDAAETFKVGSSTIVSFIEGDATKFTVRVSGDRRSYTLQEMPVRMGLALADRKMDVEHAATLARKGAYIVLHLKNQMTLAQGKQMLRDAAAAGAISEELATFYEDDYSLSELGN